MNRLIQLGLIFMIPVACADRKRPVNLRVQTDSEVVKSILMMYQITNMRPAVEREEIDELLDSHDKEDPWGNPYYLGFSGDRKYTFISNGPDGIFGSEDDQVVNFTLKH